MRVDTLPSSAERGEGARVAVEVMPGAVLGAIAIAELKIGALGARGRELRLAKPKSGVERRVPEFVPIVCMEVAEAEVGRNKEVAGIDVAVVLNHKVGTAVAPHCATIGMPG